MKGMKLYMKDRYDSKVIVFLILTRVNNGKKQILLQKRKNTGYMDGKYDMACSGHLEKRETLSQAVVREAKEEIGITINEMDLELVSVIHPYQENYLKREHNILEIVHSLVPYMAISFSQEKKINHNKKVI